MSKADKMFLDMEYIKFVSEEGDIMYKSRLFSISFIKRNKRFIAEYIHGDYNFPKISPFEIDMDLLQAINEKAKELGWI